MWRCAQLQAYPGLSPGVAVAKEERCMLAMLLRPRPFNLADSACESSPRGDEGSYFKAVEHGRSSGDCSIFNPGVVAIM